MIHHSYKFVSQIRLKIIVIHFSRLSDLGKALILLNNCLPLTNNSERKLDDKLVETFWPNRSESSEI